MVVVQPIGEPGMSMLREAATVVTPASANDADILSVGRDAEGLIVRLTPVSANLLAGMPHLRVVGRYGVGVDNIDVQAATRLGIVVVNAGKANTTSVAEHVVCLILALAKCLRDAEQAVRSGAWGLREQLLPRELAGKVLGVVGFGSTGRAVARICSLGLGMRVCAFDPYVDVVSECEVPVRVAGSLEELLSCSDIVSLHVPLTESTRGLIGRAQLVRMKRGAYLVNASRGGVVDEAALVEALEAGLLGGAALDVFSVEPPPPDSALLRFSNVVVTPHIAGISREARVRMSSAVAQGVLDVLSGGRPDTVVNPEALERRGDEVETKSSCRPGGNWRW